MVLRVAALAAVIAGTGFVHGRMDTTAESARGDFFVPRPEVARATALGFDAVIADYYWLQAVQVVGREEIPEERSHLLAGLIDVVTTLDPWVDHPYRFAAVWLTQDEASVRAANALLRRGIEHHPDDWRNRFYLGFNHFFYLDEREAAAEALEGAIALPGAPVYLRRLVARLKSESGGLDVAEAFLRELVRGAPDPYARAEYEKALDEITTERRARVLDAARLAYVKRHGRDIARVEDLAAGEDPVLRRLPSEPHGWEWSLDPESGSIVSSYLRHRYRARIDPVSEQRLREWHGRDAAAGRASEES
jgi:tetratricopeptide (TPR) repeat protein